MDMLVSKKSKLLIEVLLTDPKIAEVVYEDSKNKEKYKICTICDNGSIIMGKTRFPWWNQFINCQDVLPFESFALKVWNALVNLSNGINQKALLEGLSREIIMNSVRDNNYDWVVNRLYDCWVHVAQKSSGFSEPMVPAGTQVSDQDRQVIVKNDDGPRKIVINIGNQSKVIPIVDSVGDTWDIGLEVGVLGFKKVK